jgi:hypothetical protein
MCRQLAGLGFVVIFSKRPAGHALKTPAVEYYSAQLGAGVCFANVAADYLVMILFFIVITMFYTKLIVLTDVVPLPSSVKHWSCTPHFVSSRFILFDNVG